MTNFPSLTKVLKTLIQVEFRFGQLRKLSNRKLFYLGACRPTLTLVWHSRVDYPLEVTTKLHVRPTTLVLLKCPPKTLKPCGPNIFAHPPTLLQPGHIRNRFALRSTTGILYNIPVDEKLTLEPGHARPRHLLLQVLVKEKEVWVRAPNRPLFLCLI